MKHEEIQYIEFLTNRFDRIEEFYTTAFQWTFTHYGPEYIAFDGEYVSGGFALGKARQGSVLVILFSEKLEETRDKVKRAGGEITKEIFNFPGGRRFEFEDPDHNRMAVWSNT